MSKPVVPRVLKPEVPDLAPAAEARRRAFQQSKDSCPVRGGTPGKIRNYPGNH